MWTSTALLTTSAQLETGLRFADCQSSIRKVWNLGIKVACRCDCEDGRPKCRRQVTSGKKPCRVVEHSMSRNVLELRFQEKINEPAVREYFTSIGLDVWDAWSFFKLLDLDEG